VEIEESISSDLNEILASAENLSEIQKMFLQQQLEASSKSDGKGHRWRPAMIRLALHIKMVSSAAYDALQDSGVIKFPCNRTLFNYSNFVSTQEGVNLGLLDIVRQQVEKLEHEYQKYHAVLVDEIYISQNLVYRKENGSLVGYAHLSEVDKEMAELEKSIQREETETTSQPAGQTLATTMLAFMVKGVCSRVKCVVASYPTFTLNKDVLYERSWDVISKLELAGVRVIAYICDGHPVNRGSFDLHTPITDTKGGVVFDTINFCSPDRRPLFFISDVCHLLKTARNCFFNFQVKRQISQDA
jgi:pheromone shutdown protein TraB